MSDMKRMIVTGDRDGSSGWDFGSYRAAVIDAVSLEEGARRYRNLLLDKDAGLADIEDGGEPPTIPTEVGICLMLPLGDLSAGTEYVASGPDRKHSAEAFDILFGYYVDVETVTVPDA